MCTGSSAVSSSSHCKVLCSVASQQPCRSGARLLLPSPLHPSAGPSRHSSWQQSVAASPHPCSTHREHPLPHCSSHQPQGPPALSWAEVTLLSSEVPGLGAGCSPQLSCPQQAWMGVEKCSKGTGSSDMAWDEHSQATWSRVSQPQALSRLCFPPQPQPASGGRCKVLCSELGPCFQVQFQPRFAQPVQGQ